MKICPQCSKEFDNRYNFCPEDGTPLVAVVGKQDPLVGKTLKGKYEIVELVREDNLGRTFMAQQMPLGRTVLLEVINSNLTREERFHARLSEAIRKYSKLQHVNIGTIYDMDETDDGRFFITSEYIQGQAFSQILQDDSPLEPERALNIFFQIADALHHAHANLMDHGYLTPQDILVYPNPEGRECVQICNFGISRLLLQEKMRKFYNEQDTSLISVEDVAYLSPDQASGAAPVDDLDDIYSLGMIMYHALSGDLPFQATSADAMLEAHTTLEPVPLRNLPQCSRLNPLWSTLIEKCLRKKKSERYQSIQEVKALLQRIGEFIDGEAEPTIMHMRQELGAEVEETSPTLPPAQPRELEGEEESTGDLLMPPPPPDKVKSPPLAKTFMVHRDELLGTGALGDTPPPEDMMESTAAGEAGGAENDEIRLEEISGQTDVPGEDLVPGEPEDAGRTMFIGTNAPTDLPADDQADVYEGKTVFLGESFGSKESTTGEWDGEKTRMVDTRDREESAATEDIEGKTEMVEIGGESTPPSTTDGPPEDDIYGKTIVVGAADHPFGSGVKSPEASKPTEAYPVPPPPPRPEPPAEKPVDLLAEPPAAPPEPPAQPFQPDQTRADQAPGVSPPPPPEFPMDVDEIAPPPRRSGGSTKWVIIGVSAFVILSVLAVLIYYVIQAFTPSYGELVVKSYPDRAKVYLNGDIYGSTPYRNENIDEGTYTLEVRKEGYEPFNRRIEIKAGEVNDVPLVRLKKIGQEAQQPTPSDAEIAQMQELQQKAEDAFARTRYIEPKDDSALYYIQQILALDPENEFALNLRQKIVDMWKDRADKAFRATNYYLSRKLYGELVEIVPDNEEFKTDYQNASDKLDAYYQKKQENLTRLQKAAQQAFDRGNVITPPDDNAYELILQMRDLDRRNRYVSRMVPRIKSKSENQIDEAIKQENWDQAQALADAYQKYFPKDNSIRTRQQQIAQKMVEARQESQARQQELERQKQIRQAKTILATAVGEYQRGNYANAVDRLKEAVKLDPQLADAYFYLGASYLEMKNYDLARQYFTRTITIDPNHAMAHLNLGILSRAAGDYAQAINSLKKVVALGGAPNYPVSRLESIIKELEVRQRFTQLLNKSYAAEHKKFFGGTDGYLVFSPDSIRFETSERGKGFNFPLKSVRNLKFQNSDEMEFSAQGKKYTMGIKNPNDYANIKEILPAYLKLVQ